MSRNTQKPPPLDANLLEQAYRSGYFPMADSRSKQILWYRPNPRAILPLDGFHVSRSLRRTLSRGEWTVSVDQDFLGVMHHCADRPEGTWMTQEFFSAYGKLQAKGKAHSLEVWTGQKALVGGVYGVALGGAFFAESMFHRKRDASKVALFHLVEKLKAAGFLMLEVQFLTPHLESLGAVEIPDREYMQLLENALTLSTKPLE